MKRKKYAGRAPALLLWLLLGMGTLTACRSGRLVFTTGFSRDEVFRVGSQVCTRPEIMVYLTNAGSGASPGTGQAWRRTSRKIPWQRPPRLRQCTFLPRTRE